MPKPASTRPAYKMLTCIYLCRTLLFFAPYADFFREKEKSKEERLSSPFLYKNEKSSSALFLNFTYMIDTPEHEQILRENEDILYGNGGPTDRVTADKVLAQMRQSRTLCVGLVYSGNGVLGLGGGSTFGAYQQAWLQHYWNTYSCEIMFHELGHVMGYSHSSSFTYGPWAQQLMNNFYVTHLKDFPIDSPRYLESSSNATLYR